MNGVVWYVWNLPAKLFDTSSTPFCRQHPSKTPTTRFWLPILPEGKNESDGEKFNKKEWFLMSGKCAMEWTYEH